MPILQSDIKLLESLDMSEDGGGGMSNVEVIDNVVENVFPNVTRLDRATGATQLRKLWVSNRSTSGVLKDSIAYLENTPDDPKTYVTLLDGRFDDAQEIREKYLDIKAPSEDESKGWLLFRKLWDSSISGLVTAVPVIVLTQQELVLPNKASGGHYIQRRRSLDVDYAVGTSVYRYANAVIRIGSDLISGVLSSNVTGTQGNYHIESGTVYSRTYVFLPSETYSAPANLDGEYEIVSLSSTRGDGVPTVFSENAVGTTLLSAPANSGDYFLSVDDVVTKVLPTAVSFEDEVVSVLPPESVVQDIAELEEEHHFHVTPHGSGDLVQFLSG